MRQNWQPEGPGSQTWGDVSSVESGNRHRWWGAEESEGEILSEIPSGIFSQAQSFPK